MRVLVPDLSIYPTLPNLSIHRFRYHNPSDNVPAMSPIFRQQYEMCMPYSNSWKGDTPVSLGHYPVSVSHSHHHRVTWSPISCSWDYCTSANIDKAVSGKRSICVAASPGRPNDYTWCFITSNSSIWNDISILVMSPDEMGMPSMTSISRWITRPLATLTVLLRSQIYRLIAPIYCLSSRTGLDISLGRAGM